MTEIIKLPFKKKETRTTQEVPKTDKHSLDEQFHNISQKSHIHLQKGELGLYACDLYSMSELIGKRNLTTSNYIH